MSAAATPSAPAPSVPSPAVPTAAAPSIAAIVDNLDAELGALPPGTQVASEHELMKRFGVGRSAVRSALSILEGMYRVRRVQGRGTFVNKRVDYLISRATAPSLHKTVEAAGGTCRTILVETAEDDLPDLPVEASFDDARQVQRLSRLSHINGLPAVYLEEWIPHEVCEYVEVAVSAVRSVDETLRGCGYSPTRSWCQVSTALPPERVRERLELEPYVFTWLVESVTVDQDSGRGLLMTRGWTRQDAIRVVLQLT